MTRPLLVLLLAAAFAAPGAATASAQDLLATAPKQDFGIITGSTRRLPVGDPQLYCVNIADEAADARAAWQTKTIAELEAQLETRMAELERKRTELEALMKRREEMLARAGEQIVGIYARMNPEAAARQLAALDEETAASVLVKLKPREASAILSEMEPGRAARLARAIVGSPLDPKTGKRS